MAESNTRERLKELPLICAGEIEKMKRVLREYETLDSEPVLCHGDYAPKHILCGESINGIIDFGCFQGGSGYCDLAYFARNSDEKYFGDFLDGYGEIDENELHINKIVQLMGYLAHSRKIGDDGDARRLEKLLRKELR